MNIQKNFIWVLSDDRPGNYSQSIGLAEQLAKTLCSPNQIQIKKITYNNLAKLPNCLKINGMFGIDKLSRNSLMGFDEDKPKIIISAGRKTAIIAAFLKKYYNSFVVQIMNPNLNFSKFDLVILPNHDRHDRVQNYQNVLKINGSLTRISEEILSAEYQKFSKLLDKIDSPKIALLVGGSSKKGKFSSEIAQSLGGQVSLIAKNMGANLLVLSSRRTGEKITEILDQNLSLNCFEEDQEVNFQGFKIFFKWQSEVPKDWQNPYFAVLQSADFIIATGDSISMCSEICSIGKPVYIFNPPEICSPKHLKFHQNLFDLGFAKKIDGATKILENFSTTKLSETQRISALVADLFLKRL
jgi:mitochondrial fission protein ELM1